MKIQTCWSYISYIDRSVVCVYPLLRSHVVERSCGGNNDKTVCMWCKDCRLHRGSLHVTWTQWLFSPRHLFVARVSETGSPLTAPLFWQGTEGKERVGEMHEEKHRGRKDTTGSRGGPFWFSATHCFVSLGSDEAHGTQVLARWWRMWLPLTCP